MKYHFIIFLTALFAFATDQWSKAWAVAKLTAEITNFLPIIPPIFNLQYAENYGINFGLANGFPQWVWIIIPLIFVIGIYFWARKFNAIHSAILTGLLIGGALGNIWDRIHQGFVTDFINNSLPNWHNPFSYNLADIWIFIGIIGLVIWEPKRP